MPAYTSRAFGAASFLLVVVIVLFLIARKIGGWGPGHLTPRGQRRVAAASARDVSRFAQIGRRQYGRMVRSTPATGSAPADGQP